MPASPLLAVEALEVIYDGAILAVRDVSLSVNDGEIVALLGANGAGKSSLLRAVSNIVHAQRGRISAGRVLLDGVSTKGVSTARLVRRGLVQVLEGRHCFRGLSVEDNLVAGAIGGGFGRAETARGIDHVYALFPALAAKRKQVAGLLSGGQQQMVAIGRALMAKPRLLLLDEPSMGLAPIVVAEIFQALGRLNREEGLAILLAEQNAAIALRYAHRAVVLENGAVAAAGPAKTLLNQDDIRAAYLGFELSSAAQAGAPAAIIATL
jgi:branched-chain amino acid transport system ATP-binding protein